MGISVIFVPAQQWEPLCQMAANSWLNKSFLGSLLIAIVGRGWAAREREGGKVQFQPWMNSIPVFTWHYLIEKERALSIRAKFREEETDKHFVWNKHKSVLISQKWHSTHWAVLTLKHYCARGPYGLGRGWCGPDGAATSTTWAGRELLWRIIMTPALSLSSVQKGFRIYAGM